MIPPALIPAIPMGGSGDGTGAALLCGGLALLGAIVGTWVFVKLLREGRRRRAREKDPRRACRAFLIALSAEHRAALGALVKDAREDPGSRTLAALRDGLLPLLPDASAAAYAHENLLPADFREWAETFARGGGFGAPSGYRDAREGQVVLLLAVQHSCELITPEAITDRDQLRAALESSIPAADEWIVASVVRCKPEPHSAVYPDDALLDRFPQLRALAR